MVPTAAIGSHDGRADPLVPMPNQALLHGTFSSASPSSSVGPSCRRIQVSREKRPLNFFVTLSKKFLLSDNVIELSGLGLAVTTVVTIAEILRSQGLVYIQHINTSLVEPHPDGNVNAPKAKIQVWIHKTPDFDTLTPAVHLHFRHGRNHGRMLGGHNRNHQQSHHHHHHYHQNSKGNNSNAGRSSHKGNQRHRLDGAHEGDTGNTHRLDHIDDEEDDIVDSGVEDNVHIDSDGYVATGIVDNEDDDVNEDVIADDDDVNNTVTGLLSGPDTITGAGTRGDGDVDSDGNGAGVTGYDDNDAGDTKVENRSGKHENGSSDTDVSEKTEQVSKVVNRASSSASN